MQWTSCCWCWNNHHFVDAPVVLTFLCCNLLIQQLCHLPQTKTILTLSLPRVINFNFFFQSLTRDISYTMENLAIDSLLTWKLIEQSFLTTSLNHFLLEWLGEYALWAWDLKGSMWYLTKQQHNTTQVIFWQIVWFHQLSYDYKDFCNLIGWEKAS